MNKIMNTLRKLLRNTVGGGAEILGLIVVSGLILTAGLYVTGKLGKAASDASDKEGTNISKIPGAT